MDACYENGFVQSFDWGAWAKESRRDMREPALVQSAKLAHKADNRTPSTSGRVFSHERLGGLHHRYDRAA